MKRVSRLDNGLWFALLSDDHDSTNVPSLMERCLTRYNVSLFLDSQISQHSFEGISRNRWNTPPIRFTTIYAPGKNPGIRV